MIAVMVFASSVVLGGGIYYLFRPVRPKLSQEELSQIVERVFDGQDNNDDDDVMFEVVPGNLQKDEEEIIQKAFLKGPDFRWMYAGKDMDAIKDNADLKQGHQDFTYYMIHCMLSFVVKYGTTVVARDAKTHKMLGSFSLIPPYASDWLYQTHFLSVVIPFGIPVPQKQGKGQFARFNAFDKAYHQLKKEVIDTDTNGSPYWTVEVVAVADNEQGRGIGRKLMSIAKGIAESNQAPLYLACHDENKAFYNKMGFSKKSRVTMSTIGIEDTSTFCYNGMAYSPTGKVEKLYCCQKAWPKRLHRPL